MTTSKKPKIDIEKSLNELETIIEEMESGKLSLEDSLTKFEKGIHLVKTCQTALNEAEQKIQLLTKNNGELTCSDSTEEN